MLQGARIQYRNYYRAMALGGIWNIYKSVETFSGVVLARAGDCPDGVPLLANVQTMGEQRMLNNLSNAIRKGV